MLSLDKASEDTARTAYGVLSKTCKAVAHREQLYSLGLSGVALGTASDAWLSSARAGLCHRATGSAAIGLYAITGHPVLDTTYSMQGSEGQHVLVPIKPYEGRILAMLESLPNKPVELRITGLLRDDVRSVQRGQNGGIDGPFLGLYRERMGLPAGTRIYFLDTSKRAGLTLTSVLMFLIPFYFGLLFAVQPVRRARG